MSGPTIVWFRKDLRCDDNPALAHALQSGGPVLPLFIWSPEDEQPWSPGAASRWWLHHALHDLNSQLEQLGLTLYVRSGGAEGVLRNIVDSTKAEAVCWNRRYEASIIARDTRIKEGLRKRGIEVRSFNGSLLFEPWTVNSGTGGSYKVYTPFRKNVEQRELPSPVALPNQHVQRVPGTLSSEVPGTIESLGLLPEKSWDAGFYQFWEPKRNHAISRLKAFLSSGVKHYHERRDLPSEDGTTRLSPYLHWGQLGPREVMAQLQSAEPSDGRDHLAREILWREFGYHVLYHYPHTTHQPLQSKFRSFPWHKDEEILQAWQRGRTGYPIVDAGMRQLWQTGWMHNRVRMVVASFLVKHLLHSWQDGAAWFWDTLVDADLASNTLGWQWAGGCGADAAPYFRIFNPMTQGKKFDPDGTYVKRFVPELKRLPAKYIHEPWLAPENILQYADLKLGSQYPLPVIDHDVGRKRALEALQTINGA